MNKKTLNFITENPSADLPTLLLSASKYPGIDIPTACSCIAARRKTASKIPSWHSCGELLFPYPTALEQCSSEATARYKQRFVSTGWCIADLTAGLGVDAFFLAQAAADVECWEHNEVLCRATRHNMALLHADNVTVHQGDSSAILEGHRHYDLIYLDPDRRSSSGRRLYSIAECEPDITSIREGLFRLAGRILVKVSPMADITALISLLPETSEVHVLSVKDECREVLLLLERGFEGEAEITAADIDMNQDGIRTAGMTSTVSSEKVAHCRYAADLHEFEGAFVFQPFRAIVKAGFLKLPSERFGVTKISPNIHLYLSHTDIPDFPGKRFRIDGILPFSGKLLGRLATLCPAASVTARDFPLTSEQLRTRSGIREDGRRHIFAFRTGGGEKHLLLCTLLSPSASASAS